MIAAGIALLAAAPAARAQIRTFSAYSGNTLTDTANANYNMNLTTVTGSGSAVYSNNVTTLFSTSYSLTTHTLGTLSTPTPAGTGNTYSTTASVTRDSGLISYDGGAVANAGALSPFSSASGGGSQGYYLFKVPFTLTAGQAYNYSGAIHSDNETFDVILDYGTSNAQVLTLSGTKIQGTANDATTDGTFKGSSLTGLASGSHTMSFVVYNDSGAMTTSFGFSAYTPEPSSFVLLASLGLPSLAGVAIKRRKRRAR